MKQCIVHIGMHKTGTTSIQSFFHENPIGENYTYLNLGQGNHGGYIASLFEQYPENVHIHREHTRNKEEIALFNRNTSKQLIDQIENNNKEYMIISGEGIINISTNALVKFKEFLDQFFDEIIIVAYIRKPGSYISSIYQQAVKRGNPSNFDIQKYFPNYKKRLSRFDEVFGVKNVHLWLFNVKQLYKHDIVEDFISKYKLISKNPYIQKNENESISKELFSLLYI